MCSRSHPYPVRKPMKLGVQPSPLTGTPPGLRANTAAAAVVTISFLTLAVVGPMARKPLPQIDAFIPAYEAALAITDLITASLLLAQFLREKSAPLLLLCCGYLFNTLMIIAHASTFPGVFSSPSLLGAGSQTAAWLYLFWHGGFALCVLGYAALRRPGQTDHVFGKPIHALLLAITATALLVAGLSIISTAGHKFLPTVMEGGQYSIAVTKGISPSLCVIGVFAMSLLWRSRKRSTMDLWLLVVMCAWQCDVMLSAVIGASRFDLGWYAGRSFGLVAASCLLVMLLSELNEVYGRLAKAELNRATALFEAVINMTPDLVFVKDLQSRALLRNPAAMFGRSWEEIEGRKEVEWHSRPEEAEQVVANDREVIASGESKQFVERFTTGQGERVLLSTKSPLFDEAGNIVGTIGVSTDITERESRAKHLEFIMHELSHRSKNLLSVVLAIARQSAKQSVSLDEFSLRFEERLSALARLHDLLVEEEWRGASLHAVVRSQIAPFDGGRVSIEGLDVKLRPDVAQTMCMVFHELATNASKYGALSKHDGRVTVTSGYVRDGGKRLFVRWQETNGPPVAVPHRRGFGTVVIERMSLQVKDASASLTYSSNGVVWYLNAPYESFVQTLSPGSVQQVHFMTSSPAAQAIRAANVGSGGSFSL
jgi:PAS domain S-box-containing protein